MTTSNQITTTTAAPVVDCELMPETTQNRFSAMTSAQCVDAIIKGFEASQQAQRLTDEAMAAYLLIEGNTVGTLKADLDACGYKAAKQTLANRQSKLRKAGLLPAAAGDAGRPVAVIVEEAPQVEDSTEESGITSSVIADELQSKVEALEAENAQLRAKLAEMEVALAKATTPKAANKVVLKKAAPKAKAKAADTTTTTSFQIALNV